MTDTDLRALAEAATPGPWRVADRDVVNGEGDEGVVQLGSGGWITDVDRAYIAAVDPQTVLALLDRAERAEAVLRDLRDQVVRLKQPTLGLAGGVNRGEVIDLINRAIDASEEAGS